MGMVKTSVRVSIMRCEPLDEVLYALQHVLPDLKEPSSYVTFAGLRFSQPHIAEYSTAGHPPILQYHAESALVERLAIEQFPVGIISSAEFRAATTRCARGDLFLMLTDGLVELANARDEEFGLERVEELLIVNAAHPLSEIAGIIVGAASRHGERTDDQTILVARVMQ